MNASLSSRRLWTYSLAVAALAAVVSACAPLAVGSAVTGAIVATDRRTAAAQLEDQSIELRAPSRLNDQMGSRARIVVTSYNRRVLLTGEVANERDKAMAEAIVKGVDNVALVFNELGIANSPSLTERAADTVLTGRVKAGLLDAKNLAVANAIKVVSERGTVYLMGIVSQKEADEAASVARTTKGAQRVVRVMEILGTEELNRFVPPTPAPVRDATPARS